MRLVGIQKISIKKITIILVKKGYEIPAIQVGLLLLVKHDLHTEKMDFPKKDYSVVKTLGSRPSSFNGGLFVFRYGF